MSDTLAPVLTGLTLPSVINLGAGDTTITYSARATDNIGVASVWITFDRQIVGSAGPTATWLMREEFGEDFAAAPISRDLLIRSSNIPGPVTVTDVTVYDDAGNTASYTTTDLVGLGLPTGFTLSNAVPDETPPVLTGLTLPGQVDVTNGDVAVSYSVTASDNTEVEGVWLTFERPASGTNPAANRWLVYDGAGEDWQSGPIDRDIDIRQDTVPGHVTLYSVTVFDVAGNVAIYDRPALVGLGFPIAFEVRNSGMVPSFAIDADLAGNSLVLAVSRDGAALASPQVGLVLRLETPGAATPTATLIGAGSIDEEVEDEGDAQTVRVAAEVAGTVADGASILAVTLPVPAGALVDVTVLGIEVDGVLSYLPNPSKLLVGSAGNDALSASGAEPVEILGGAGQDTLLGGASDDILVGGPGSDQFRVGPGGGTDIVADFVDGTDLLDLTAFSETAVLAALSNAIDTGQGARIDLPGGPALILTGVAASALDIDDTTFESVPPPPPPPPPDTVWEVHRLTLSGAEQVVDLAHSFTDPVAIARAPSYNNATPVAVRISEVTSDSVHLALQRPDYLSGQHPAEEVTLIVVEAGSYRVGDATVVHAGTTQTGRFGTSVAFDTPFDGAPAVFTQVQTENDPGFVITRQLATTEDSFWVNIHEEEAAPAPFARAAETVGWLAVSTGSDTLGATPGAPGAIEVGRLVDSVDDQGFSAGFQSDLGSDPGVLTSLTTSSGSEPAFLRLPSVSANGFDVFVQEEQSKDAETAHPTRDVHYLAIAGEGTAQGSALPLPPGGADVLGEVMSVRFDDAFTTYTFANTYENPVVFIQPLSFWGEQPATARIANVWSTGVSVFVQEPADNDGIHAEEDATLLVMEAGRHTLPDGTVVEVGTIVSDLLSPQGFERVTFSDSFDAAPAIVSQVQGRNGADFVVTRQDNPSATGFDLTMQEEEALNNGGHFAESIGWMAIEHGSGEWSGLQYEAGTTGVRVGGQKSWHAFDTPFDSTPELIASVASYRGIDPVVLRNIDTYPMGFDSFVQEEKSFDFETGHIREIVDYLAIEGEGVLMGTLDGTGVGGTAVEDWSFL